MDELSRLVAETHPQILAEALREEDALSIAIFALSLDDEAGAKVLSSLPKERRAEVASTMLKMELAPQEMVEEIRSRVKERIERLSSKVISFGDTTQRLARMLSRMPYEQQREILSDLDARYPGVSELIRERSFTFEDLKRVSDPALKLILRLVSKDARSLALALLGASEETRAKIFRNLPEEAVQPIRDEMEALGEVSARDIQEGQRRVMMIVRRLEEEGLFDPRRDIVERGEESGDKD